MPYFRRPKDHEHPYAQISNQVLDDGELSFKAKGILSYLLARSDDWEIYQSQLADLGPDGETAVRSGLKELREVGYLERKVVRGEDGQYKGYEYIVYEQPTSPGISENEDTEMGKPNVGDQDPTNKDSTNTQSTKKETNSGSGTARAREVEIGDLWDFIPEEHQDVMADVKSTYQELQDGRADVPMLAKRVFGRNGRHPPMSSIAQHSQDYSIPKVVAAYVIAGIKADSNPFSYANTILEQNWTRPNEQSNDTFEEKAKRIYQAAGRGAGVDGF